MPFDKTLISVFHLLQQACIEIAKISHITCCKDKPPSAYVYPRFVYNRFMWGECITICVGTVLMDMFAVHEEITEIVRMLRCL